MEQHPKLYPEAKPTDFKKLYEELLGHPFEDDVAEL